MQRKTIYVSTTGKLDLKWKVHLGGNTNASFFHRKEEAITHARAIVSAFPPPFCIVLFVRMGKYTFW